MLLAPSLALAHGGEGFAVLFLVPIGLVEFAMFLHISLKPRLNSDRPRWLAAFIFAASLPFAFGFLTGPYQGDPDSHVWFMEYFWAIQGPLFCAAPAIWLLWLVKPSLLRTKQHA
jgi:hypothetical protein